MPYIPQADRPQFDEHADRIARVLNELPEDALPGALNYVVTRIAWQLCGHGGQGKRRYARMNAVVGALECTKLELYRRIAAPYEDEKIASSGDVVAG